MSNNIILCMNPAHDFEAFYVKQRIFLKSLFYHNNQAGPEIFSDSPHCFNKDSQCKSGKVSIF